jgi:hypothetical protein
MSSYIKNSYYNHKIAAWLSVLFTLLIISPRLISLAKIESDFKHIYPVFIEDETHYEARIKEVVSGRWGIGNPFLKEHENDVFLQPPLPEWIIGLFVIITGLSVPLVLLISNFFIIPILFLLSYFLFYKIIHDKNLSLISASIFFVLFFQTFGRPISPQLTTIFLISGLLLLCSIYFNIEDRNKNFKNNFLIGLITGINLFVSPYYWTTLLVVYSFVLIFKLVQHRKYKDQIYDGILFLLGFSPALFIYTYFTLRAHKLVGYSESLLRFGLIHSHWPGSYTNIFLAGVSLIALLATLKFIENKKFYFGLILILSIIALNWQNVVTGQALQFPSHYLVVTVLFSMTILTVSFKVWLDLNKEEKRTKHGYIILILTMGAIFILFIGQYREFSVWIPRVQSYNSLLSLQNKSSVLSWLNDNTEDNSVIYVLGNDLQSLTPIYTHDKVYFDTYSDLYVVSQDEITNRWLIQNIFNPQMSLEFIKDNQKSLWVNRYIDSYFFNKNKNEVLSLFNFNENLNLPMISDEMVIPILGQFKDIKKQNIHDLFKKYELDYIVLTPECPFYNDALGNINKLSFVHKVYDSNNTKIYKVD